MGRNLAFAVLLTISAHGQTIQTYNIDSLKAVLARPLSDTARVWAINNLSRNLANSDTTLRLAEQAIELSRRIDFPRGEAEAYNNIGYWFNQKGNYPAALESYLKAIDIAERIGFDASLRRSYNSIATVFLYRKDYQTALAYATRARALCIEQNDKSTQALASSWISRAYSRMHQPDSALKYAQESYVLSRELNDGVPLFMSTGSMGEVHESLGNYEQSLEYLRLALRYANDDQRPFRIAGAHMQMANCFVKASKRDSAMSHARRAFEMSQASSLPATLLSSSLLLSTLYEGINDSESLRYNKVAMAAKDTLFSEERNNQVESLKLKETLRQQEIEYERTLKEISRRNNLQYAALAVGVLVLMILFLLLSTTMSINPAVIQALGVMAMLILFEFINLLIDPLISQIAQQTPIYTFLAMVLVAAVLIPVHGYIDMKVVKKIVERNRKLTVATKSQ